MYVKTNWVDNTTPIDENNLNKIEKGIYDNSLVVDAVTDKLNPTDTETYKPAELTEGQITDVIGVKDIIIKGQTEQDGTPTPSAPVDVNVISGSNVVNTSNKNLFDGLFRQGSASTLTDTKNVFSQNNKLFKAGTYTFSANLPNTMKFAIFGNTQKFPAANAVTYNSTFKNNITQFTFTFSQDLYLGLMIAKADNSEIIPNDISTYHFQIEQNNSATSYIAHQGKELPLDLPVENLFDGELELGTFDENGNPANSTTSVRTKNYIQVKPNTTYTISNNFNYQNVIQTYNSSKTFIKALGNISTFTTDSNTYYIKWRSSMNANENNLNVKYQIEQGSKANAYTPYGTEPIELCKIGNYQDYFYKSGSKWYLHKKIGKVILDGVNYKAGTKNGTTANIMYTTGNIPNIKPVSNNGVLGNLITSHFKNTITDTIYNGDVIGIGQRTNEQISIGLGLSSTLTTLELFNAWLAENNVDVYYLLATPTDISITDTTLISQLEAIYNAPLYEQTNITQTNNDLPMVLDITACKDNINGIKAFIRK